jgi:hypothetical protein
MPRFFIVLEVTRKMFKVGTVAELEELVELRKKIPEEVYQEALRIATYLDETYGAERDVELDDGGYIYIAENREDWDDFNNTMEGLGAEYMEFIPTRREPYLKAFFLYKEYEQGANLLAPVSIVPGKFLKETYILPSEVVGNL